MKITKEILQMAPDFVEYELSRHGITPNVHFHHNGFRAWGVSWLPTPAGFLPTGNTSLVLNDLALAKALRQLPASPSLPNG